MLAIRGKTLRGLLKAILKILGFNILIACQSKVHGLIDGLIIQAVADQLNLRVFIVESHINFNQFNIIQAQSSMQSPTVIYLGHLDE